MRSQRFPALQEQRKFWHLRRQVADWCTMTSYFSHRQAAQESVQPALHQTNTNMHRHLVSRQSICEGSLAIGSAFNLDTHCTWPRCKTAVYFSNLYPSQHTHTFTHFTVTRHAVIFSSSLGVIVSWSNRKPLPYATCECSGNFLSAPCMEIICI